MQLEHVFKSTYIHMNSKICFFLIHVNILLAVYLLVKLVAVDKLRIYCKVGEILKPKKLGETSRKTVLMKFQTKQGNQVIHKVITK